MVAQNDMKTFFFRKLAPYIAGALAVVIVKYVPQLAGAEEAVTSAILAVLGVFFIAQESSHAKRQEIVAKTQRVLKAEGLYAGKIDGKFGDKSDNAVRAAVSIGTNSKQHPAK